MREGSQFGVTLALGNWTKKLKKRKKKLNASRKNDVVVYKCFTTVTKKKTIPGVISLACVVISKSVMYAEDDKGSDDHCVWSI